MTNDGLNNLEYGIRDIIKNRLFTKLMIESRLLVPNEISISTEGDKDPLIHIGTLSTKTYIFDKNFRIWLDGTPKWRKLWDA